MAAPKNIPNDDLIRTVTVDVTEHPRDLSKLYCDRYAVSRVTANRFIQRLEQGGWLSRSGPSTHPVFSPGYRRRLSGLFPLSGLDENHLWEQSFSRYVAVPSNVRNILHHGFTEMVNNAIDHSQGKSIFVFLDQTESRIALAVSDNGIGIFKKISDALQLADQRQAIFELSKGKLTTDPTRHSGEGIFFTSRMFDSFSIEANGLDFSHLESVDHDWLEERKNTFPDGTSVYMEISLGSTRTTSQIFEQYMNAPEDYGFNKTVVPMKLAQYGDEQLVSRSQAKRLIARFDRFKVVVLDFEGVAEIGQAFADEMFRVYARAHPDVELVPMRYSEQIERMWLRAVNSDIGL
jgi:anti-sigma regulatory factor (Ser/Thr protein kinase)